MADVTARYRSAGRSGMMRFMRIRALVVASLTAAASLTWAGGAAAAPTPRHHRYPGGLGACSPAVSLLGYDDELDKRNFGDQQVAGLSGLAFDGRRLLALDDRSALWSLSVRSGPGRLSARPVAYQPIRDGNGEPLDDEAIVVDRDGTRLITSEKEPSVRRYDRHGRLRGRLPVPSRFAAQPAGQADPNGSFEGLTLLPGGRSLIATMEEPLSADGTDAGDNGLVRFLRWDRTPGHGGRSGSFRVARQYAFTVDAGLGISDARAISPTRMLILERGWTAEAGNTIRLYEADLAGAQDVTGVDSLADTPVRQVHRRLLADLVNCPTAGATNKEHQTNPLLDNIEGMTLTGRHLPHGRRQLLPVSDDNHSATQTTRLYSLAVRVGATGPFAR